MSISLVVRKVVYVICNNIEALTTSIISCKQIKLT